MMKGFTFVELAIVLVIIGIIMGMAVKGKELIRVAKMRYEVNKVRRVEAGVYSYFAKAHRLPEPNGDRYSGREKVAPSVFIQGGYFNESDLFSNYLMDDSGNKGQKWEFIYVNRNTSGQDGRDILAIAGRNALKPFVCFLELYFDDMDIRPEKGRGYQRHASINNFTPEEYADCFKLPDERATYPQWNYIYYVWW